MIHWIKSGRWDKVRHHLQTVLGPEVHHIMNRDERHG